MGNGSIDMRLTDIWSLGVILFFMVTFNNVFFPNGVTEDQKDIEYKKMLKRLFPFPRDCVISYECRRLISQLLDPNQYSRMNCQQILLNEWFDADLEYTERRPVPAMNRHSFNFDPSIEIQRETD